MFNTPAGPYTALWVVGRQLAGSCWVVGGQLAGSWWVVGVVGG